MSEKKILDSIEDYKHSGKAISLGLHKTRDQSFMYQMRYAHQLNHELTDKAKEKLNRKLTRALKKLNNGSSMDPHAKKSLR